MEGWQPSGQLTGLDNYVPDGDDVFDDQYHLRAKGEEIDDAHCDLLLLKDAELCLDYHHVPVHKDYKQMTARPKGEPAAKDSSIDSEGNPPQGSMKLPVILDYFCESLYKKNLPGRCRQPVNRWIQNGILFRPQCEKLPVILNY